MKSFKKFLEEVTIKGNPGIPNEGDKKPGDKNYLSDLERDAKDRLGVRGANPREIIPKLMQLIEQSKVLCRGKKEKIEKLAYDIIQNNFGHILEGVELDIKLLDDGKEVSDFMQEEEEENGEMPNFQEIKDKEVINKIHKAKIGNNIIQGEAKNTKHILHTEDVRKGIEEIFGNDFEEIFKIWDNISKLADKMDWIIPIEIKADMMEQAPEGMAGAVKVDWEEKDEEEKDEEDFAEKILKDLSKGDDDYDDDLSEEFEDMKPVIKARGIDFPMLLHETVKGIYELIAAVSQPDEGSSEKEIKDAQTVKLNVSSFEDEAEDFRTGPEIASDFRDFINESPGSSYVENIRAFVFGKMMDKNYMTSKEFLKLFRGILNKTDEARKKVDSMVKEIVDELKKFDVGEVIGHEDTEDGVNHDALGINKDDKVDYKAMGMDEPEDDNNDNESEDYSKLSQKEVQDRIDNALDTGNFEEVKKLSEFLKEGKEIYLNELKMIKENHRYHKK